MGGEEWDSFMVLRSSEEERGASRGRDEGRRKAGG